MRIDLYQDLYDLENKHWWHISKKTIVTSFVGKFLKKRNANILDIGCGTGKNLESLKEYGKIYGLDSAKEAISFCKQRGLNIRLGQAENIPFKSDFFDLVTLLDVLEHTDDNKTLKEVYRVLKKDGLLILSVPAFSWLWSKWDDILNHKRRYNKKDLIILLKHYNFTIIYITYLYSFLVFPALIIRKIKQRFSNGYSSDFKLSNTILNKIILFISGIEFMLAKKKPIPFGTSIFVIAKK